mgnify:CR=1 FL=1
MHKTNKKTTTITINVKNNSSLSGKFVFYIITIYPLFCDVKMFTFKFAKPFFEKTQTYTSSMRDIRKRNFKCENGTKVLLSHRKTGRMLCVHNIAFLAAQLLRACSTFLVILKFPPCSSETKLSYQTCSARSSPEAYVLARPITWCCSFSITCACVQYSCELKQFLTFKSWQF